MSTVPPPAPSASGPAEPVPPGAPATTPPGAMSAPTAGAPTHTPPPPVPPQPSYGAGGGNDRPPVRSSSRVIAILAIVFGGILALGTVGFAAASTITVASASTTAQTASVAGVSELTVDQGFGSLRVDFADVREAELVVTSTFGSDGWTLERTGTQLRVASPSWRFGFGWPAGGETEAVLTLPDSLAGLDADLSLGAGEMIVSGDFDDLVVEVGAGRVDVSGSAESADIGLAAGHADLQLDGVDTADLSVSAGQLDGELTGPQPDEITLDVSAGALYLTVPDGDYDVTSDVSAGEFDNRVGSTPGAASSIDVQVSAGQVVLDQG